MAERREITELTVTTAAIRFADGLIVTMPRPHRHGSLINRTHCHRGDGEHGFMLSDSTFADRRRAYEVAEGAGQIKFPAAAGSLYEPLPLFTENLWDEEVHHG